MKKILITDVASLLGSRLSDWIVDNTNYEVIGIDDLSGGFIDNINPKVKFYKFNLTNLKKTQRSF
jgi:UDP-glucose 4-epimerase